jgi:hypothetical protein
MLHLITIFCRKFYYVVLGLVYRGKFGTAGSTPRGLIMLYLITFSCRKFYYHVVLGLVYRSKFGTAGSTHVV